MIELLCDINTESHRYPKGVVVDFSKASEALLVRKGKAKYVNENVDSDLHSPVRLVPDNNRGEGRPESGKHNRRQSDRVKAKGRTKSG